MLTWRLKYRGRAIVDGLFCTVRLVALSVLSCFFAVVLRFSGAFDSLPFRDLIEHFFSYLGIAIGFSLILLFMMGGVVNRSRKELYCIMFLSLAFCGVMQWNWELTQAYEDVYGAGARGFIQFDQLIMGFLGAVSGMLFLRLWVHVE